MRGGVSKTESRHCVASWSASPPSLWPYARVAGACTRASQDRHRLRPGVPADLCLRGPETRREIRQSAASRREGELPALSSAPARCRTRSPPATIDMGPFGTAPLLTAWEKSKETTPQQIFAVSGHDDVAADADHRSAECASIADLQSVGPHRHADAHRAADVCAGDAVGENARQLRQIARPGGCDVARRCDGCADRRRRPGDRLFRFAAVHADRAARRQGASRAQLRRT